MDKLFRGANFLLMLLVVVGVPLALFVVGEVTSRLDANVARTQNAIELLRVQISDLRAVNSRGQAEIDVLRNEIGPKKFPRGAVIAFDRANGCLEGWADFEAPQKEQS